MHCSNKCPLFIPAIILSLLCLFLCWLLLAPVELEIDTDRPYAAFRWISIGSFRIWYEEEWRFSISVFFIRKEMPFAKIKKRSKKKTSTSANGKRRINKQKTNATLNKILQVAGTLQVAEWQLAIDSGRYDMNARLYPLNFLSCTSGHLFINFQGVNFMKAKLRGRPWKILYAFLQ